MRRRMTFADRNEAGLLLAERLSGLKLPLPLVLALPRGGVPVAAPIAKRLHAPLDVGFARKLGAPHEPELAIGAVVDCDPPEVVLNESLVKHLKIDEAFIQQTIVRELAVLAQRRGVYVGLQPDAKPSGRTMVVVDDGVATGMTMQAALRSIRKQGPKRLLVAVPVASRDALAMLQQETDEVVCLSSPRRFGSVGSFYRAFEQVSDADVTMLLQEAAKRIGC